MKQKDKEEQKTLVIFLILVASCIISSLVQTALSVAIPPIMEEMGVTADTAQWLTSAYSLIMGIMVLATAYLIRRFPTRPLYIAAMGIFTVGLLLAALAHTFPILLIGRLTQAVGCGILMSLAQVVILTIFPPEKRGTMMGIYGLAVCTAPVLAPTLAGIIIDRVSWNGIFWISLGIAVVILVLGMVFMQDVSETKHTSFDWISMVLCGMGYTALLLGVGNLGKGNQFIQGMATVAAGVIFITLFVCRQRKLETPFLQLKIFSNREFRLAVIASMLLYAAMMAGSTLVPIYIQTMRGMSATTSGLISMPGSLVTAVMSLIAGRMYDKMGVRKLYLMGTLVLLISSAGFIFLGEDTSIPFIILIFALRSVGIGMLMMTSVTWGMSKIEARYTSDGTAIISSLRTVAGSFGATIFFSVMTQVAAISSQVGSKAMILGNQVAFAGTTVLALILFVMAITSIGKEK